MFGDRKSGAFMHKFSWTNVLRHALVKPGPHSMTPRSPTTGPGDGANVPCRSTTRPYGSTEPRMGAARSAKRRSRLSGTCHKPTHWERGWRPPARRSTSRGTTATRTRPNPVSDTCAATTATARHCNPPTRHQGLLEPDARKRARPVLGRSGTATCRTYPTEAPRTPSAPDTLASAKAGVGRVVVSDALIARKHVYVRLPVPGGVIVCAAKRKPASTI